MGVDANPEAHEHARLRYTSPRLRFERSLIEDFEEGAPWDAIVFLQTVEHVQEPRPLLERFASLLAPGGVAYVSTPNRLTLAAPGAEKSGNPWHVREYTPAEYRAVLEPLLLAVDLLGVYHARKLRAHELALRLGWDRVHAALRLTRPFYDRFVPAIDERDFAVREGRARPRTRSPRRVPAMTSGAAADRGELAIVLHSHMPYVEGFGTWPFGEEWLLEAIAASYLPLLRVLEAAAERGGQAVATVGRDARAGGPAGGARARGAVPARSCATCAGNAIARTREGLDAAGRHADAQSLRRSARDYEWAADDFERRGGDLLGPLRRLHDAGAIELWTSAATHAVLPMLATEQGVRLQLATGIGAHRERFGAWSGGFWLPECAYRPGIEEPLAAAGVRAFCVDQTGHGDPLDQLEPVAAGGAVAMPIDWQTISMVWDEHGYPADAAYRDYHAQTVNGMRAVDQRRRALRPRRGRRAGARARAEFVEHVIARANAYRAAASAARTRGLRARHGAARSLVVRGAAVARGGDRARRGARPAADHAAGRPRAARPRRRGPLAESSWGTEKDLRTWDSPRVADLVWAARQAELDLVAALGSAEGALSPTAQRPHAAPRGSCSRSRPATGRS